MGQHQRPIPGNDDEDEGRRRNDQRRGRETPRRGRLWEREGRQRLFTPPFLAGVEGKMRARNRIFDARGFKAILVGGIEEDRLRYDVAQCGQQFALDNAPIVKRKRCNSN